MDGRPPERGSLAAHAADVVAGLPDAGSVADSRSGVTTWRRDGHDFAALGSARIEIRLDRAIAAAACRTPDVAPSPRGPEWIRFSPRELDAHALDRLRAWLELAYRRAGE